jgi:DNA repair protein RecO (recombination protein O)
VGESHREAWFLTPKEGILKATVFGGPKSRLRSQVAPFHQGTLWLYHDPVRDTRKVTDFDVQNWRPGIREQYERTKTGSSILETLLASHAGGGTWQEALRLTEQALDALASAEAGCCARILAHFLWNWLDILGLGQDVFHCGVCGRESLEELFFNQYEGILGCPFCAKDSEDARIGLGARRWLALAEGLPPDQLFRFTLDESSLTQVKTLTTGLMAIALGRRLESWDTSGSPWA